MPTIAQHAQAAQELAARMAANYPALNFEVFDGSGWDMPEHSVIFEHDEMCMYDPTTSVCTRFSVDPKEAYGIEQEDAEAIKAHNHAEVEHGQA